MPTLPDIADLASSYGGIKADEFPIDNYQTQESAADRNRYCNDTAMMVPVAMKGYVRLTTATTSGGMALVDSGSQWSKLAPNVPVLARTGTGIFTVTLPATVQDQLINDPLNSANSTHNVLLRGAFSHVEGSTFSSASRVLVTSPNVITLYTASGGTASDIPGTNILVWYF